MSDPVNAEPEPAAIAEPEPAIIAEPEPAIVAEPDAEPVAVPLSFFEQPKTASARINEKPSCFMVADINTVSLPALVSGVDSLLPLGSADDFSPSRSHLG
jgi:hypothetical protein